MAKLTTITVADTVYDIGDVKIVDAIPTTITSASAALIIFNNTLYIKQITDGVYSYSTIAVDAPAGTTVVANPTLDGSESTLTAITIDGVNYSLPEPPVVEIEDLTSL